MGQRRYRRRWARPTPTPRSPLRRLFDLVLVALLFALLALLAARLNTRPPGDILAGSAYVIDGDTISIGGSHIRLKGIDAPELAQDCGGAPATACGRTARQALVQLVGGRDVRCEASGRDKYDRTLATCYVGGTNINRAMVEAGQAVAYGDYHDAEAQAQRARKGLWASNFETPQDWRREHEHPSDGSQPSGTESPLDQFLMWIDRLLGGLW